MAASEIQTTVWTPDNIEKILNVIDRLGWVVLTGLVVIFLGIVVGVV